MSPRGRPIGAGTSNRPFKMSLLRVLDLLDSGKKFKIETLPTLDRITLGLIEDAQESDPSIRAPARQQVADRLDGKPHQQIEVDSDVKGAVTVTWVKPATDYGVD